MQDTTSNPSQGGSYERDPDTGELTPLAVPEDAQPALRRHADDEHTDAKPAPAGHPSTEV